MTPEQVILAILCATVVVRELCYQHALMTAHRKVTKLAEFLEETTALMLILNEKVAALEEPQREPHPIREAP